MKVDLLGKPDTDVAITFYQDFLCFPKRLYLYYYVRLQQAPNQRVSSTQCGAVVCEWEAY